VRNMCKGVGHRCRSNNASTTLSDDAERSAKDFEEDIAGSIDDQGGALAVTQ